MKDKILIAVALLLSTSGHADSWTGRDKELHALGGAVAGSLTTLATGNANYGCAVASGLGLAKEIYDSQHKATHTVSAKDFAVTAIAGCLAAAGTGWVITPKDRGGISVAYKWDF
jgi:hypothetical protein